MKKFEVPMDSISLLEDFKNDDQQFLEPFLRLKSSHLIILPSFSLKVDTATIIRVYLDESEYENIKDHERSQLVKENNRVEIILTGEYISDQIVRCSMVRAVIKTEGKTDSRK
ncbi:MAG: hypothetical protein ACJAS3_001318 [Roseivirga sp.]|jgi:hypothetical protein